MLTAAPLLFDALLLNGGSASVAAPTANVTLRWVLDAFPAPQTATTARTLLRNSRNAIVVRDVVDVETDRYVAPATVTWALANGATVALSGTMLATADGWRAEVALDPSVVLPGVVTLRVTAALSGATWTRVYPILLTETT